MTAKEAVKELVSAVLGEAKTKTTYAAMTVGGCVLFSFEAENSADARETVKSLRKRSDTITGIRKLRPDDMPRFGTDIVHRGEKSS